MNPAGLKANLHHVKKGGALILNMDAFDEKSILKAGYEKSPLESGELEGYQLIETHITSQTLEALKEYSASCLSQVVTLIEVIIASTMANSDKPIVPLYNFSVAFTNVSFAWSVLSPANSILKKVVKVTTQMAPMNEKLIQMR